MDCLQVNSYYYGSWDDQLHGQNVRYFHLVRDKLFVVTENELHEYSAFDATHLHSAALPEPNALLSMPVALSVIDYMWFYSATNLYFWHVIDRQLMTFPFPNNVAGAVFDKEEMHLALYYEDGTLEIRGVSFDVGILPLQNHDDDGEKPRKVVSVGWGSAKTQFQGRKEVKQAQKAKEKEYKFVCKDTRVVMDWDPVYEHIVVGTSSNETRIIKIFNEQGVLCNELDSSKISGIFPCLNAVHGGICAIFLKNNKQYEIRSFDMSGDICFEIEYKTNEEIVDFQWSKNQQCLAVHVKGENSSYIRLYLKSDNMFCVKQELPISLTNPLVTYNLRSNGDAYFLELFMKNSFVSYMYRIATHRSQVSQDDICMIATINDQDLCTMVFAHPSEPDEEDRDTCIFGTGRYLKDLVFHDQVRVIAIIDKDDNVAIISYKNFPNYEILDKFTLPKQPLDIPIVYYRFYFSGGDFHAIAISEEENYDLNYVYHLKKEITEGVKDYETMIRIDEYDDFEESLVESPPQVTDDKTQLKAIYTCKKNISFVKYAGNRLYMKCFVSSHIERTSKLMIDYIPVKIENLYYNFFLDNQQILYLDDRIIENSIKIMCKIGDFLLLVKDTGVATDTIITFHLTHENMQNLVQIESICFNRVIEKVTNVLQVIECSSKVVVQMVRGNFEFVTLNGIALYRIYDWIENGSYEQAYLELKLFRTFPLDNLFDLSPDKFIANVRTIVCFTNRLMLLKFVQDLKDESSLTEQEAKFIGVEPCPNRVKTICNALLGEFGTISSMKYFSVALLCGYLRDPVNEQKSVMEKLSAAHMTGAAQTDDIVEALQALNKFIPYEYMCKIALHYINFDLARLILKLAKQDPLLFNNIIYKLERTQDLCSQRFALYDHIKDFDNAVKYLLEMHRIDALQYSPQYILSYAVKHNVVDGLYNALMKTRKIYPQISTYVINMYIQNGLFKMAGKLYFKIGKYRLAAEVYMQEYLVDDALEAIRKHLDTSDDSITVVHTSLLEPLKRGSKMLEAYKVYTAFFGHDDIARELLLRGNHFEALYKDCIECRRIDYLKRFMIPRIKETIFDIAFQHQEQINKIKQKVERLYEVRRIKQQNKVNLAGGDNFDDVASLASSLASSSISRASMSTEARRRKKEERKYLDSRIGAKYEDIALMREIHEMIDVIFKKNSHLHRIFSYLAELDPSYNKKTREYYDRIVAEQNYLFENAPFIWPETLVNVNWECLDDDAKRVFDNYQHLDKAFREKPSSMQPMPPLQFRCT